jgi:predicted transcriptional regulator
MVTNTNDSIDLRIMVAEIVAAYVSNNTIEVEDLPDFMDQVHNSLCSLNGKKYYALTSLTEPAVPIEESIKPDYLICLEDGKRMKMLKRHLRTSYDMTPDQYRERWNLPSNYPMVAPNYSKRRQGIAKSIGLGSNRKGKRKTAA